MLKSFAYNKKGYTTLCASCFIVLFLFSILIFTKRNLEPSIFPYRTFLSYYISSTNDSTIKFDINPLPITPNNTLKPVPSDRIDQSSDLSEKSDIVEEDNGPSQNPVVVTLENDQTKPIASDQSVIKDDDSNVVGKSPSDGNPEVNSSIESVKECDLYTGSWVRVDEYPNYMPASCPYVDEGYDCQRNRRPDSGYVNWRWKPAGCDLPRFNATDFLERIRGKRLMLVGDSMNRNQYESLLCLLYEGLPNKSKMYETHGHKISKGRGYFVFKFEDYGCTVEFVRSHFLVKEGLRINGQGNTNPTLSIDRIDKSSGRWKRADILVFNTGHWWTHGKTARGQNYYKEGDYIYPKFNSTEAYRRALQTWAKWIDNNMKPKKQLVLYRGYSSAHFRGGDWDSGGTCNGETDPILKGSYLDEYPVKMKIVEEVIQQMKFPVKLLNITRLTNFRKDAHPSVFGKNPAGGKKVSLRRQDCSHWCLPGVPDTWNEIIYATLVFQRSVTKH